MFMISYWNLAKKTTSAMALDRKMFMAQVPRKRYLRSVPKSQERVTYVLCLFFKKNVFNIIPVRQTYYNEDISDKSRDSGILT